MNDLQKAFEALSGKKTEYDRLFAYYDGEQPLTYTNSRLKEVFDNLNAYFAENWCSVVIDSTLERVNLERVEIEDDGLQAQWDALWEANQLYLDSDEVHEAAVVTGEAFMIAWPNEESGEMEVFHNDPRLVHAFYQNQNPHQMSYAAKWWAEDDGTGRMTLYYPERLEYYATTLALTSVSSWQAFKLTGQAVNPYGRIPVFHFRLKARRAKSDLASVWPMQDAVNKLLTDMMVTAEFAAFPQRYIISSVDSQSQLRNAPNEVWDIPAGDGIGQQTQAGQFPAASLDNYFNGIDKLAGAISSITRTPKHYFFSIGSNLSGESIIAMESPLNKKAQDRIDRFVPVWHELVGFLLNPMAPVTEGIEIVFSKPETIQPLTESQAMVNYKNLGVPLKTILRRYGWSEMELAQMEEDQEAESERANEALGVAVLRGMREVGSRQAGVNSGQSTVNSGQSTVNSGQAAVNGAGEGENG